MSLRLGATNNDTTNRSCLRPSHSNYSPILHNVFHKNGYVEFQTDRLDRASFLTFLFDLSIA
jgi:hypothetical protein